MTQQMHTKFAYYILFRNSEGTLLFQRPACREKCSKMILKEILCSLDLAFSACGLLNTAMNLRVLWKAVVFVMRNQIKVSEERQLHGVSCW
jgi:hypothetical protein